VIGKTASCAAMALTFASYAAAGSLWIGFIANTTGGIARIAYTSSTGGLRFNNDTYSDGAANPFGTASSANEHFTIYASLAPTTPLSQRVGMNVPNIGTNNVSASYATTVFNDDGITLYRDAAPMAATYQGGTTANWTYFDRDLNFTKTVPGSMLLTFATAPDWMHPSNSGAWYPPDSSHYQDWADKVVEVIGHAIANGVSVSGNREYNPGWHTALDLGNLLTVAEAITRAAIERRESRGGHFRDDCPDKDPSCARFNIVIRKGADGEMELAREPIKEMPAELKRVIEEQK
jgi:hypothetical protein